MTGYGHGKVLPSSPELASFYISSHTRTLLESFWAQESAARCFYLCTHDSNLSCGPGIVGVTTKVFGAHDIIGTTIGLEQTQMLSVNARTSKSYLQTLQEARGNGAMPYWPTRPRSGRPFPEHVACCCWLSLLPEYHGQHKGKTGRAL